MSNLYRRYTRFEDNKQSSVYGSIRVVRELSKGVIIECSYFGENFKENHMFRNKDYTRQLNNHLGYSINKDSYTEMSVSNLKELLNKYNFTEDEQKIVLEHTQTYYISYRIGDAYLEFFSILQAKEMLEVVKKNLLLDEDFKKEVLKDFLDNNLVVNNTSKKINKI